MFKLSNMSKETQQDKIIPFLNSEVYVECTKCNSAAGFFQLDDYDAADELVKLGWYATENNIFCPKCQKNRKKTKVNKKSKKK